MAPPGRGLGGTNEPNTTTENLMAARMPVRAAFRACTAVLIVSILATAMAVPASATTEPASAAVAPAPQAQAPTGTIEGRVTSIDTNAPVSGARVSIVGTQLGALTGSDGTYRIGGVSAGAHTVRVEHYGFRTAELSVTVVARTASGRTGPAAVSADFTLRPQALPVAEVVVTASREAQRLSETPATISSVSAEQLRQTRPSHPSEIMNRVPGVWINVTGGEGHMAAIRQPKTTNPVYLYLENGVPTRSTGFFNHNALYEINVPQAQRIEVLKGPATALYGSDAIGGMVNVLTRAPREAPPVEISAEAGTHGFVRVLGAASWSRENDGIIAELNATRTDGWREGTAYDRQSGSLRWDRRIDAATSLRTMLSFSRIDQATAGSSAISRDDYLNAPEVNYAPISYRRVDALRGSAAFERLAGGTLLSITPFARWNRMEMLPNWSLTYDPAISETGHASAGALFKARRDFDALRIRVIVGFDVDYSPGVHREWAVQPTREGPIFTDYMRGDVVYDYDVTFWSAAPYVQLEAAPVERLRLVGGLRFDAIGYDYDNPLGELQTGAHRRPASTAVSYNHLSPKLGAIFTVTDDVNAYANYNHGFRAPSEGQLFRQGRAASTLDLQPVKADNAEIGVRARLFDRISIDAAAYRMRKTDDLLGFTRPDGSTETVNAGETLHRGVEIGLAAALPQDLRVDVAYSHARHTYEEWTLREGTSYSGLEMEDAPRNTSSAALTWTPRARPGTSVGLEAQRIGSYWIDPENTHRYDGHTLVNLGGEVPVTGGVALFMRVRNVLDERYAESAQFTAARGEQLAPGMPRAFYFGVQYR
jgi:iron complex outermembrane recepter protein